MSLGKVVTLDGSSFLIANTAGDLTGQEPGSVVGFFYRDMRHLSEWRLSVNGASPQVLACDDVEYYFTQHFLAPATGTIYENPYLSVARRRLLGDGFVESLEVMNHSATETTVELKIDFACDFADLFEVKDALKKQGTLYQESRGGDWVLGYRREGFERETLLRSLSGGKFSKGKFTLDVSLKPKETKIIEIHVIPVENGAEADLKYAKRMDLSKPNLREEFREWVVSAPRVQSDIDAIVRVYRKSIVDLAALRFFPDPVNAPDESVPSAGLPWFMALFGRDSLLTSYQALPFVPELAAASLKTLARLQGTKVDPFREEEPGKIPHELRFGELTVFKERPQSPYFGSADSTPLFLVVLDEYERWTGDRELVKALEPNARRALEWIDRYGDRDGDGFVEYEKTMPTGLDNQCWKDSPNSILFADGTNSKTPRATCEIQGYVYDAKIRAARLAREVWNDAQLAKKLLLDAEELKRKFNQLYWIEKRGHYALALDRDKRQVDSLSSNVGHLLWSGIVPNDRAVLLRDHIMSPALFSGWGVRTMATTDAGYNPIEYHNGTVWPHDTSIVAKGLAQYGFRAEASRLAGSIFAAAVFFNFRLPEVFAGYSRDDTEFPVEYPTASSPQAWATGAPLLGLRVLLGMEARDGKLHVAPELLDPIGSLTITNVPGPWGKQTVHAEREHAQKRDDFVDEWFRKRAEAMRRKSA